MLSHAKNVEGRALTFDEGMRLYELACECNGEIVEVGSYKGRSTCFLASSGKHVTAVDLWDTGKDPLLNPPDVFNEFKRNTAGYSITAIRGDSTQVAKRWNDPIGLLFLDGCHKYDAVKADFEAWSKHLTVNAWVAFHDYNVSKHPGVKRFVDEIRTGDLHIVDTIASFVV